MALATTVSNGLFGNGLFTELMLSNSVLLKLWSAAWYSFYINFKFKNF